MRGREKFAKFRPIINVLTKLYAVLPRSVRLRKMEHLRKKTGNIALVQRYCLLKTLAKSVGDNVSVYPDVYLRRQSDWFAYSDEGGVQDGASGLDEEQPAG